MVRLRGVERTGMIKVRGREGSNCYQKGNMVIMVGKGIEGLYGRSKLLNKGKGSRGGGFSVKCEKGGVG